MSEPLRSDRKAASGKFCIWVELTDGSQYRLPDDFDSADLAWSAAQALAKQDQTRKIDRVLVYDGQGWFKYKLERR